MMTEGYLKGIEILEVLLQPQNQVLMLQENPLNHCWKSMRHKQVKSYVKDNFNTMTYQFWFGNKFTIRDHKVHFHANKRNKESTCVPKYERTFWIDRVVHIGVQTGYVGYEWCEVEPANYKNLTVDLSSFKRTSKRKVDGIGFNKCKNNMMVLEGSSPLNKSNTDHEVDDTLKILYCSIWRLSYKGEFKYQPFTKWRS